MEGGQTLLAQRLEKCHRARNMEQVETAGNKKPARGATLASWQAKATHERNARTHHTSSRSGPSLITSGQCTINLPASQLHRAGWGDGQGNCQGLAL